MHVIVRDRFEFVTAQPQGAAQPVDEGGEPLTVDATSHATPVAGGTRTTITWPHTCGPDANKIVVKLGTGASDPGQRNFASVTYNGVACTQLGEADDGGYAHAEEWRLNDPPTGAALDIVATFVTGWTGDANECGGGATSYNNAHATEGAVSTNTGTGANPSVTVADSADGDIVSSLLATDNESAATTAGGNLEWEDEGIGTDLTVNAQNQAATGANAVAAWTNAASGSGWAAIGVPIRPAA